MATIINLRTARKQGARKAARAKADVNAAKHGQTKADRKLHQAQSEKATRDHDGHRRGSD